MEQLSSIKARWPKSYQIIKNHVLAEMKLQGGVNEEILGQFPIDNLINASLVAGNRSLYDILDQQGIRVIVDIKEDVVVIAPWFYKILGKLSTDGYIGRKEAEYAGFTTALDMLEKR